MTSFACFFCFLLVFCVNFAFRLHFSRLRHDRRILVVRRPRSQPSPQREPEIRPEALQASAGWPGASTKAAKGRVRLSGFQVQITLRFLLLATAIILCLASVRLDLSKGSWSWLLSCHGSYSHGSHVLAGKTSPHGEADPEVRVGEVPCSVGGAVYTAIRIDAACRCYPNSLGLKGILSAPPSPNPVSRAELLEHVHGRGSDCCCHLFLLFCSCGVCCAIAV